MFDYLEERDLERCDWQNDFPLITCGTGSGKTDFVMSRKLANHIERETGKEIDFTLLLVPTRTLKQDVLSNYKDAVPLDYRDLMQPTESENIRVACFAQIVQFLLDGNEITNVPDLIVLDEMDCLVSWTLAFKGYASAFDWILSKRNEMFVCGLTATPALLLDYMDDVGFSFRNITPNYPIKHKTEAIEVVSHSSVSTYLKTMRVDENNKALVYIRSARRCRELKDRFGERAGFIVSTSNENYEKQSFSCSAFGDRNKKDLRDYLIEENKLPPHIDLLFINDSMNAGFNINDKKVKTVIAESVDLSIGIQVKGRIRNALQKFVFIYNNKERESFRERLDVAREFFDQEPNQDFLKGFFLQEGNEKEGLLLVYRCGNRYKVNPFAKPLLEYEFSIYRDIDREGYFKPLAAHSDNEISFINGSESLRNIGKVVNLDLRSLFGFREDETEKHVAAKELTEIAKSVELRDAKGNILGKDTFCNLVNERTGFSISSLGRKQIKGKRATYYLVKSG